MAILLCIEACELGSSASAAAEWCCRRRRLRLRRSGLTTAYCTKARNLLWTHDQTLANPPTYSPKNPRTVSRVLVLDTRRTGCLDL